MIKAEFVGLKLWCECNCGSKFATSIKNEEIKFDWLNTRTYAWIDCPRCTSSSMIIINKYVKQTENYSPTI